ncbi:regulatory protein GemA [Vandammella animalimorsus]|uniref:regulatory protein GemA n=1 Tax=Vandammella animalimorsus TaxID=2029117 RepID=UPI00325C2B85
MTQQHIAAIHTLKAKLRLSDDDYRALLLHLTGKNSSKAMSVGERARVRDHLHGLAVRAGLAAPTRLRRQSFDDAYAAASPRERKVWALWNQLHRQGRIASGGAKALNAWVKRQTGVDALRFCNGAQLDALIEALKLWQGRPEQEAGHD